MKESWNEKLPAIGDEVDYWEPYYIMTFPKSYSPFSLPQQKDRQSYV
jgi:hypothetical protein